MRVSRGNLTVGMTNCDTSHKDETLFNAMDATGEYDLDLQVRDVYLWFTLVQLLPPSQNSQCLHQS